MAPYEKSFELRWSDADANGHVRHSVYADLGAETRMAWLRDGGISWQDLQKVGIGPVLLREELVYRRELVMGEHVRVDVRARGLSSDGGRWRLRHDIYKDGDVLAARITVTGGWLDHGARRLTLPPPEILPWITKLERTDDFVELPPLKREP